MKTMPMAKAMGIELHPNALGARLPDVKCNEAAMHRNHQRFTEPPACRS